MKFLGNIVWLLLGGLATALEYFAASIVLAATIIGIPFALQTVKLGVLELWPFGSRVETTEGNPGCLSTVMNIIWFFAGGFWIMITHFVFGILLYLTIIGIPWGNQHFKLAGLALTPFGRTIVPE